MKMHTIRGSLSGCTGVCEFDVPEGARLQSVETERSGQAVLCWSFEGTPADTAPSRVLFLWSEAEVDEEAANWRHVGCIGYPNGRRQHVFAEAVSDAPAKPAPQKRKTRRLDSEAAE